MDLLALVPAYWRWHYTGAFRSLYHLWLNFTWFFWHLFSVGTLARTIFAPWRRIRETYHGGLDLADWAATIFINSLMRVVGALVRMAFILIGLFLILLTFIAWLTFIVVWLCLPFIVLGLFTAGVYLLLI